MTDYKNFICRNPEEKDTYEELVRITVLLNQIRTGHPVAFDFVFAYLSGFADGVKSCEQATS